MKIVDSMGNELESGETLQQLQDAEILQSKPRKRTPKPKQYSAGETARGGPSQMHDEEQVLKDLTTAVQVAVEAMPTPLDQDALIRECMHILRHERTGAIWKLMGFDASWGRWEFDRVNGKDSPAAKWFAKEGLAPLHKFMTEQFGEIMNKKAEQFREQIRPQILKQIDDLIKSTRIGSYEINRRLEAVVNEEIKAAVEARRQDIKDHVLRNMHIDPENYRGHKKDRW